MQINLVWDSSAGSAPSFFKTGVQDAANLLGQAILNPVTVNIQVGWGTVDNAAGTGGVPINYQLFSPPSGYYGSAAQVTQELSKQYGLNDTPALAAHLSDSATLGTVGFEIASAEARVFSQNLWYPANTVNDGAVGFNPSGLYGTPWTQNLLEEVAIHEISHALGRINNWTISANTPNNYSALDLFTYSAPGVLWSPTSTNLGSYLDGGYFSIDGGKTNLGNFLGSDAADFNSSDNFGYGSGGSSVAAGTPISSLDKTVLQVLGFDVATSQVSVAAGQAAHVTPNSLISGAPDGTVVYSGTESQYTITQNGDGSITVQDTVANRDAGSNLAGVARLQFSDTSVAFDMAPTQSGGQTAEILGAAFGLPAVSNKIYAGIGLMLFDAGYSMDKVAQLAINTGLVAGGTPTPNNSAFVEAVWQNVVGTPIDSNSLATLTNDLENGAFTQASLLAAAAQISVNQTHVNLVGLSQHGLAFTPA